MKPTLLVRAFSLLMALLFAGCATYTPSMVKIDPVGPDVSRSANGDLIVYVEEYATTNKCKKAFDTELISEGVLPLFVLTENGGREEYEIKTINMVVRGETAVLKQLSPEEAARKAKRSAVWKALGWSLIVPIITIPVAVAASVSDTSKVNKQIVTDFKARGFSGGIIMPNRVSSGFVFYELDAGRKNLSGLFLEVTATNIVTGQTMTVTTPLPKADFKPRKVASEEENRGVAVH